MIPTKDKYDKAIDYLRKHPERIHAAWSQPWWGAGCLFQIAANGQTTHNAGCLTMIRPHKAEKEEVGKWIIPGHPDLTQAIRHDSRIPRTPREITIANLPVFAEWQRRLDKELQRK